MSNKHKIILNYNFPSFHYFKLLSLIFIIILMIVISVFTSGCIKSQPSKFYLLTPIKNNLTISSTDSNGNREQRLKGADFKFSNINKIRLGVGPVSIPKYLDRSQLVVRLDQNQIKLEDFHQWAGSPRDDIPVIILENISSILGINTIYQYPWKSYAKVDYQIVVDILQLDGRIGRNAKLIARWEIIDENKNLSIKSGKIDIAEPISDNSFNAFVAAQSNLLAALSMDIAKSLTE